MEAGAETMDSTQVERQKVEEKRALRLGRNLEHLSTGTWVNASEHVLQIRCLTTITNAIIDNFTMYLMGSYIDQRHRYYNL